MTNPVLARVQSKSTIPVNYEVFASEIGDDAWPIEPRGIQAVTFPQA